jgi:hypothetical protein
MFFSYVSNERFLKYYSSLNTEIIVIDTEMTVVDIEMVIANRKENQKEKKVVKFSNFTICKETYSRNEYDRSCIKPGKYSKKQVIEELNQLKREMKVHPLSIKNTIFYRN